MAMPSLWVDRIFDKLSLSYGREFLRRWDDIDIAAVKADWSHELADFVKAPHAIAYALEHLPAKAPTVIEFKAICRLAPVKVMPALPEPQAQPERVASELGKLRQHVATTPVSSTDPKAWAHRILARKDAGERISPTVLSMARRGLGLEL